jgi:hypothetical protein
MKLVFHVSEGGSETLDICSFSELSFLMPAELQFKTILGPFIRAKISRGLFRPRLIFACLNGPIALSVPTNEIASFFRKHSSN